MDHKDNKLETQSGQKKHQQDGALTLRELEETVSEKPKREPSGAV